MPAVAKRAAPEKNVIYSFVYEDGSVRSFKFLDYKASASTPTLIMANVTKKIVEYTSMTLKRFQFLCAKQLIEKRLLTQEQAEEPLIEKVGEVLIPSNMTSEEFENKYCEQTQIDIAEDYDVKVVAWLKSLSVEEIEKANTLLNINLKSFIENYEKALALSKEKQHEFNWCTTYSTISNLLDIFKKEI